MKYQHFSNVIFMMFRAYIARSGTLRYFRNLSNSFIIILAILQDSNGIFLKYSLNITMLCGWGCEVWSIDKSLENVQRPSIDFQGIPLRILIPFPRADDGRGAPLNAFVIVLERNLSQASKLERDSRRKSFIYSSNLKKTVNYAQIFT